MPDDEQQTSEGRPEGPNTEPAKKNIEIPPIPKETAGTVLGAAVGALAGPAGALVGGVIGTFAGKAAASGRPVMPAVKKAVVKAIQKAFEAETKEEKAAKIGRAFAGEIGNAKTIRDAAA